MHIRANGISINCRIDGTRHGPWLVLGNPLATNLSLWDAQVARLRQHFQVVRYDQRGHGESEAPPGRYTFEMLVDDALALFDALGVDRAHFVGLSMGGATALGIAQRAPSRLRRIAVCDCSAASSPTTHRQWEERIDLVAKAGMQIIAQSLIERWLSPSAVQSKAPHVETVRQMLLATPVNGFIGCAAAIGNHDYRSSIAKVPCPTLFLVGEKDVTAAGIMRKMHEALPRSSYVELSDAGHLSNVDQPAAFTQTVMDFLTAP